MSAPDCGRCGHPGRDLRTFHDLPELPAVARGPWLSLRRCPDCSQLWVLVPHEPFGSFDAMTAWPADGEAFARLARVDGGRVVHEWHNAVVRERWRGLPKGEREAVEAWLRRLAAGGDTGRYPGGPERRYLERSEELGRFLEERP